MLLQELLKLHEEKWSGKVKSKWTTEPEDLFAGSAEKIVKGLLSGSKSAGQAMKRLNFYINRAGKNLSPESKKHLEAAKKKLELAEHIERCEREDLLEARRKK